MSRQLFFYAYAHDRPTGGIRRIYRTVEILRSFGVEAWVWHTRDDFRVSWMQHQAASVGPTELRRRYRAGIDLLVLPEDLGREIASFEGLKVIFNMGLYNSFLSLGEPPAPAYPALSPDILAMVCVSDHNAAVMRYAYPSLPVLRVLPLIRFEDYVARPLAHKSPLVVSVAGKSTGVTRLLGHALHARGAVGLGPPAEWLSLRGVASHEVARLLTEARVVVFPSVEEGLPTFPIEALLSGCVVISHGSGPQGEYLPQEFSFAEHDVLGMARAIDQVSAGRHLDAWQAVCDRARAEILARYAPAVVQDSIVSTWRAVLCRAAEFGGGGRLGARRG